MNKVMSLPVSLFNSPHDCSGNEIAINNINNTTMILTRSIFSKRMIPWLEVGYDLFINKGQFAINVELLARGLGRNKSAFYHFFGNRETYMEFLIKYHSMKADSFVDDIKAIHQFDPEYLHLLIKHHQVVLFNSQLIKNSHDKLCAHTLQEINLQLDEYILPVWSKYAGLEHDLDLSKRCHTIIRDYMYIKITPELLNYTFLSELALEAKLMIRGLINCGKFIEQIER
jgi:AcrR family transcriptional regulator